MVRVRPSLALLANTFRINLLALSLLFLPFVLFFVRYAVVNLHGLS